MNESGYAQELTIRTGVHDQAAGPTSLRAFFDAVLCTDFPLPGLHTVAGQALVTLLARIPECARFDGVEVRLIGDLPIRAIVVGIHIQRLPLKGSFREVIVQHEGEIP